MGLCSASAGYLISQAYRMTQAGLVAPFEYTTLVLAVLWGYVIWNEFPTALSVIGIFPDPRVGNLRCSQGNAFPVSAKAPGGFRDVVDLAAQESLVAITSSISLTDDRFAFARALVENRAQPKLERCPTARRRSVASDYGCREDGDRGTLQTPVRSPRRRVRRRWEKDAWLAAMDESKHRAHRIPSWVRGIGGKTGYSLEEHSPNC